MELAAVLCHASTLPLFFPFCLVFFLFFFFLSGLSKPPLNKTNHFTYTQKLAHDTIDTMSHFLKLLRLRGLMGSLSPPSKATS